MSLVYLIDDDKQMHKLLSLALPSEYRLHSSFKGVLALDEVRRIDPDVVLLDINLPDIHAFEILKGIKNIPLSPPVVMLSASTDLRTVVSAMKRGAFDFIPKPFEMEELVKALGKALRFRYQSLKVSGPSEREGINRIVGESSKICRIRRQVEIFARSETAILIVGESGCGKDLAAEMVHSLSNRNKGPFIACNCAAIPEALFEAEIFGCENGAFTGAKARPGSFELADKGTLFLDEIGEMPLAVQAKLLRVLESGKVKRLGADRIKSVDTRIITASNRDLKQMVLDKLFREDLFYRISVLPLEIPPLRQRKEDITLLAHHFLRMICTDKTLTADALDKLLKYDWPGNIRELKNVISRACLISELPLIEAEHIQFY